MTQLSSLLEDISQMHLGKVSIVRPADSVYSTKIKSTIFNLIMFTILLGGFVFVMAISTDASRYQSVSGWFIVSMLLFGFFRIVLPLYLQVQRIKNIRRLKEIHQAQFEAMLKRSHFFLLLRSFRSDSKNVTSAESSEVGVSDLEQVLVELCKDTVPIVAIDNVKRPGLTGGAIRVAVGHDVWRSVVEELSRHAAGVVIDARDATPGLVDEVELHLACREDLCRRALVIVSDLDGKPVLKSMPVERRIAAMRVVNVPECADGEFVLAYEQRDGEIVRHAGPVKGSAERYAQVVGEFLFGIPDTGLLES